MTTNANLGSLGRFSSQMLTLLGMQRTVVINNGNPVNSFLYQNSNFTFPSADSTSQAYLGGGVVGSYGASAFDSTKCYFLSRGASPVVADTMTALAIDMASQLNISVQYLLEQSEINGVLMFSNNAYRAMNNLRDPGNQIGAASTVSNKNSIQSSQIRA